MFCTFSARWRAVTTTSSMPLLADADSVVWANAEPNGPVAVRHVAPNKAPINRPPVWAGFLSLVIIPPLCPEHFKDSVPLFLMDLERTIPESESARLPQSGDDCPPVNRSECFSARS